MVEIFSVEQDDVVRAAVGHGKCSYSYALEKIHPLIDQLDIQRRVQDPKFYKRLERDILNGCVVPPITLAFIEEKQNLIRGMNVEQLKIYFEENIKKGFVLDGIQRLSTLHRASEELKKESIKSFPSERPLYFSVLVCSSVDSLLYRMITLNNGQRPMSTRHQIEILSSNLFDFSKDSDLPIVTEKFGARKKGYFKKSDFILSYLAFLSSSTTIDNQKIIESKLDELIAFKIMENDLSKDQVEFYQALELIERLCENGYIMTWFKNVNNLIGFTSSIRKSINDVSSNRPDIFQNIIQEFEEAFESFSISKIKLGQARRNAVNQLISEFDNFKKLNHIEMVEKLASASMASVTTG